MLASIASRSTTRAGVFICDFNKGIALLSAGDRKLILACMSGRIHQVEYRVAAERGW